MTSSWAAELDDWFQRYAWQNQKANNAVVYVTAQDDVILGYYAITMATYSRDDAPQGLNHRSRPEEIPCILLARLAVDERAQGAGRWRSTAQGRDRAVLQAQPRSGRRRPHRALPRRAARAFYLANGDFLPSPANALHLLLSMKQLSRMLESS